MFADVLFDFNKTLYDDFNISEIPDKGLLEFCNVTQGGWTVIYNYICIHTRYHKKTIVKEFAKFFFLQIVPWWVFSNNRIENQIQNCNQRLLNDFGIFFHSNQVIITNSDSFM